VHATAQVCHVDVPVPAWEATPGRSTLAPADALVRRLSGVLPPDVRVGSAVLAPPGFDARFSALRRQYAYRICDDPGGVPPLRRHDVLGHRPPGAGRLDAALLAAASAPLLGDHDFAAFCRPREGATTIRTLLEYRWDRDPSGLLVATVTAQAFCHSMVRSLVGCVLEVGDGRRPVGWPAEVLAAGRRSGAYGTAPALGLTLERVDYPPDDELALRAEQARSRRSLPLA
jgi:tRNA pseudouridine38-40 synthase